MKKTKKVLSSLLFFLCAVVAVIFFGSNSVLCFQKTYAKNTQSFRFEIMCDGKIFYFKQEDFNLKNLSNHQKNFRESKNLKQDIQMLENMGFSSQEIIKYIFPETEEILNKLKIATTFEPVAEDVYIEKNSCQISFNDGLSGRLLNEVEFFEKLYNEFILNTKNISIKINTEEYDYPKSNRKNFCEKSCFSTNFESSSFERKNNIRVALSCFDGFVLEDGEVLSFNTVTGERNKDAGYKPAKIISGGTFTLGYGGGVCQVSTTLYNACLLSGLEILEVHNHSLPVSYIEPSFDAMVNTGSSDLVVRNNSGGRLIFTTSSKNDICKVKIFGKPNEFKITRFSEKTKVFSAEKEEVITDPQKAEEFGVFEGSEKRISFAKDGFESNGYLNFYDKQGNLIETKKIRTNKYNPTKGVIVKNMG